MAKDKKMKYSSKVTMINEYYKDVKLITVAKYTAFVQVVTVLYMLFYVYQILIGNNFELLCLDSGVLLVIAGAMFFSLRRDKAENFEKSFTQEDGTLIEYVTTFYEDRLEVKLSNGVTAEYGYNQVKGIKEAEKLYFLEMPKDFHIIVSKELSGCKDNKEFETYILENCKKMREKRVLDLKKSEGSFKEVILILGISLLVAIGFNYFK